ncbi:hypothetical protein VTN02DRAFT_2140 [Thermoascus thermophilus]
MEMRNPKRLKGSHQQQSGRRGSVDTSKPSAIFTPTGGRWHTLSIALPGSIIAKAQSHDQKSYVAGTIARALAVFSVDEVVVFDDACQGKNSYANDLNTDQYTAFSDPSHFLVHILSYLETPPYLRKHLFPMHPNLRTAGMLPSLDMPHHVRATEWCDYREAVVIPDDGKGADKGGADIGKKRRKEASQAVDAGVPSSTVVDTGLPHKVSLPNIHIPEYTRVTVKFSSRDTQHAEPVHPAAPREETGYYWGYSVRRCRSLSTVFTECPFDGGYDLSFGTSERGCSISKVLAGESIPKYRHLLVVFGGVAGIEVAIQADQELLDKGVTPDEAGKLFDYWVNVLPGQGSRTIRTEEAIWLGLMGLRPLVETNGR